MIVFKKYTKYKKTQIQNYYIFLKLQYFSKLYL